MAVVLAGAATQSKTRLSVHGNGMMDMSLVISGSLDRRRASGPIHHSGNLGRSRLTIIFLKKSQLLGDGIQFRELVLSSILQVCEWFRANIDG